MSITDLSYLFSSSYASLKLGKEPAELACGHFQHVRHDPPWVERLWVITEAGRANMLGQRLNCKKCDAGDPPDRL